MHYTSTAQGVQGKRYQEHSRHWTKVEEPLSVELGLE